MSDDPKMNKFMLRDKNKVIKRWNNLIVEGLVCICGHTTFASEKETMFPFLGGKKWVERIHCGSCSKIFDIEHTEKDKLKEIS